MGGSREFVTPASEKSGEEHCGKVIGNIRIHESNGEIHFHDDDNNLKTAVPVADMFSAWQRLADGKISKYDYKDRINFSKVRLKVDKSKRNTDLKISIKPLSVDDIANPTKTFQDFNQFIIGSTK